uniref:Uncharacterized protein n=1 Tax=Vespula pensylvanica TaxID=30213 RepID=A0A834NIW3_VESPE|nr:hypothetical protein H0235_013282 [Vespula pensylvanica]
MEDEREYRLGLKQDSVAACRTAENQRKKEDKEVEARGPRSYHGQVESRRDTKVEDVRRQRGGTGGDRLNVGGYAEFDGKSEKTGVSWKGCLYGWCSLGHFTQIAWILQIAHTSLASSHVSYKAGEGEGGEGGGGRGGEGEEEEEFRSGELRTKSRYSAKSRNAPEYIQGISEFLWHLRPPFTIIEGYLNGSEGIFMGVEISVHGTAGSGSPAKWEIAGELQRQAIADAMDPRTLCVDSTKTVARLWTRQSIEATETL